MKLIHPIKKNKRIKITLRCRDAITGRFVTFHETILRPETTIVEHIKKK